MKCGLRIRLKRMSESDGKMFIVPLDHGITLGAINGLTNIEDTVHQVLVGGANGIIVHKGIVRRVFPCIGNDKALGVHLNASTTLGGKNNGKSIVCDVEEAIGYGADFVSYHINFGNEYEMVQLKELGKIKKECEALGVPLLVMTYIKDQKRDITDGETIAHAVRAVEEVGADIIKCSSPENIFDVDKIVKAVRQPVLFSGGEKKPDISTLYESLIDEMNLGASGVIIGRNVFGNTNPEAVSKMIHNIVIGKVRDKKEIM